MANNINVHEVLARRGAAILAEDANFIKNINTGHSSDFPQSVNGFKIGEKVDISIPAVPVVYDGSTFAAGGTPEFNESKVKLTLDTQKHTAVEFSSKEILLDVDNMADRVMRPAMTSLIAAIEADLISKASMLIPQIVGTPGSAPSSMDPLLDARAALQRAKAPKNNRAYLMSSAANKALVSGNKALYNDAKAISAAFDDGALGRMSGFDLYESQSLSTQDFNAATAHTVDTTGSFSSGQTVTIGGTGSAVILAGQTVTFAGVYAVNPLTGKSTGELAQWQVQSDVATGATSMTVYPSPDPTTSSHIGNYVIVGSGSSSAAVKDAVATSASTDNIQGLAFQRDFCAAAFAPLRVVQGARGHTATINGVSVRVETFGDGTNDYDKTRVDVLYGFQVVRPYHAVRITE